MSSGKKNSIESSDQLENSDSFISKTDANVDMYGQCMMPADAESAGPDTGDPCDDGRAAE